jgi:hypothetical protein
MTRISRVLLGLTTICLALAAPNAKAQTLVDSVKAVTAVGEALKTVRWAPPPNEILPFTTSSAHTVDSTTHIWHYTPTDLDMQLVCALAAGSGYRVSPRQFPKDPKIGGFVLGAIDLSSAVKTIKVQWYTPEYTPDGASSRDDFRFVLERVDEQWKVVQSSPTLFLDFLPKKKKQ